MTKRTIIALEERYQDPEVVKVLGMESPPSTAGKLEDFDGVRLREMDEAGIDLQVISHAPPGFQRVEASASAELAIRVNDSFVRNCKA
jgi:hypothetical protein